MRLSLNLDEYLGGFPALTFCQEILAEYYDTIGESEDSIVIDKETYYYRLDDSNNYYEELLKTRYPIVYSLINELITPYLLYDAEEYNMHWRDWYYVAQNAYMMKGGIQSVYYIFTYLGIDVQAQEDETLYDQNYLKMSLRVQMETNHPDIVKENLYKLCSDLLLIQEKKIFIDILYLDYLIQNTTYFFTSLYTNRMVKSDERYFIGDIDSRKGTTEKTKKQFFKDLLDTGKYQVLFGNNLYPDRLTKEDIETYAQFYSDRLHQGVPSTISGGSRKTAYTDIMIPSFYEKLAPYHPVKSEDFNTEADYLKWFKDHETDKTPILTKGIHKNQFDIIFPRMVSNTHNSVKLSLDAYTPHFYKVNAGLMEINLADIKRTVARNVLLGLRYYTPRISTVPKKRAIQASTPSNTDNIINLVPTFIPM